MEIRNVADMASRAENMGTGARVTQVYPEGGTGQALLAVDLWEIEPGGSVPARTDAEEHVLFVVSGSGELGSGSDGAASALLRPNTVVHVAHHEAHSLRNTGREPLRVLVSTPLLVRSERALGSERAPRSHAPEAGRGASRSAPTGSTPTGSAPTASPGSAERPSAREPAPLRPSPSGPAEPEERPARRSEVTPDEAASVPAPASEYPASVQEAQGAGGYGVERPAPDISGLVKRASEVPAGAPRERRRPEEPTAQPGGTPQEPRSESEEEASERSEAGNLIELLVVFDGGSRGSPGQGYGSYMVQSPNRKPVVKRAEFGPNYTQSQAEYQSLIECLNYIIERLEATNRSPEQVQLDIKTDSEQIVNQLSGTFKVKDASLRGRHKEATDLLERFADWVITLQPREESVRLLGH
jgi:ribonuclease HI